MKKKTILIAAATTTAAAILTITRIFGLWPEWMIRLELIAKARLLR
jgi:hypothetical protein